jgi:hypothetical protein
MEKQFREKSPFPIPVTPDFPILNIFLFWFPAKFLPITDYAIPRSGL